MLTLLGVRAGYGVGRRAGGEGEESVESPAAVELAAKSPTARGRCIEPQRRRVEREGIEVDDERVSAIAITHPIAEKVCCGQSPGHASWSSVMGSGSPPSAIIHHWVNNKSNDHARGWR